MTKKRSNLIHSYPTTVYDDLVSFFEDFLPKRRYFDEDATVDMPIDITENKDSYKVSTELAGLNKNDIDINIDNNRLVIKGHKITEKESKDDDFITRERSYGEFKRVIALPEYIDTEKAKAKFSDGVLKISFPKKEGNLLESKKIKIE